MYRYVEGVEGEGEAAHGGVDAVGVAGGAYRGCAVDVDFIAHRDFFLGSARG